MDLIIGDLRSYSLSAGFTQGDGSQWLFLWSDTWPTRGYSYVY